MTLKEIRRNIFFYPDRIDKFLTKFIVLKKIFLGFLLASVGIIFIIFIYSVSFRRNVLKETVVGKVNYLSPLVQTNNQIELDLYNLMFNSLIKGNTKGEYIPELAESWTISNDGKVYTVYLRKNILWQDGYKFTSKDVLTTFRLLKEGGNNAHFGNLLQKINVSSIDDYTVVFKLPQSNAAFLQVLTVPIVPDHIYHDYQFAEIFADSLYIPPIGTGPYKLVSLEDNKMILEKNEFYFKGEPKIDKIIIYEADSENAAKYNFIAQRVDSFSNALPFSIKELKKQPRTKINSYTLIYNTKVIFFNLKSGNKLLHNKDLRLAILYAINKDKLVSHIQGAQPAYGPYSDNSWAYSPFVEDFDYDKNKAEELLDQLGWKKVKGQEYRVKDNMPLILTISYYDSPLNRQVIADIKQDLKEVGIQLEDKGYGKDELLQEILPTRDFDMLLFEIKTDMDPDQYSLWHSSQANYPGLNISGYSSNRADWALEQGRINMDVLKRERFYEYFQKALMQDVPVIFLFKPSYFYVYYDYVKIPEMNFVGAPEERFNNVQLWQIDRKR